MKTEIKILLVDDEPTVRQGLRMRLQLEPDLAIIGEANDGLAALKLAQELQPDVVVMDVELPHMDGLTATKGVRGMAHPCSVVVSSIHDNPKTRVQARAAGAAAFVSKHEGVDLLIEAIRQAAGQREGG